MSVLNQDQQARRRLLKLALGAAGLLTVDALRRFLGYRDPDSRPARVVLEQAEFYASGNVVALPEVNSWLVRDGAGFYAISRVCPHLGCLVREEEKAFTCPCHGSRFSRDGAVVNGPANRPLRQVQVEQSGDGRLVVNAGVTVPAGTRLKL